MSYDEVQHGHPLGPGSPYYKYQYICECGWEYDDDDAENENEICPSCLKELTFKEQ